MIKRQIAWAIALLGLLSLLQGTSLHSLAAGSIQQIADRPDLPAEDSVTMAKNGTMPENPYWQWTLLHANDSGNWEIYLYRRDENNFPQLVQLTHNTAQDVDARFNYGADKIVFVSDRDTTVPGVPNTELYLMDADGNHQQRLTNNALRDEMPAWSLAGNKIVYSSEHEDGMEIYVINPDGTGRQRLTNRAGNDWFPSWSPDGKEIVWMQQGANTGQIWIMNADGSNQRPLTDHMYLLGRPLWSPDGRHIAFSYVSLSGDNTNDYTNIGIVNRDGGILPELRCRGRYPFDWRIPGAWALDSGSLLFTRYQYDDKQNLLGTLIDGVQIENRDDFCDDGSSDNFLELHTKVITDIGRADPWPPQSALRALPPTNRLPNLILQLSGADVGRSGLLNYDVQYRLGDESEWKKGETHAPAIVVLRPTAAGQIAVRSRARDVAGNEEAWPAAANGESSTLLYRALFQGQYTDQRGIPLANQPLEIGPIPLEEGASELDGSFRAHVDGVRYTVKNTMRLSTDADWTRHLVYLPQKNLLVNGAFETAALSGWTAVGDPLPQVQKDVVYNGAQSLRLGSSCVGLCTPPGIPEVLTHCLPNVMPGCIDPDASYPPNYALFTVRFFADTNDNLHFIGNTNSGEIIYQHGRRQDAWDAPIVLNSTIELGSLRGATQANGDLHLIWSVPSGVLFYQKRSNNGVWSTAQAIGSGRAPEIAIDSKGLLHILYTSVQPQQSTEQSLHYRQQKADGSWAAPVDIARYPYNHLSLPNIVHTIAITADDRVHLAWDEPEGEEWAQAFSLIYKMRAANGRWGDETNLGMSATMVDSLQLLAATTKLHLLWQQDGSGFYASRTGTEEWTEAEKIGPYAEVTIDSAGTLHLYQRPVEGTTYYYRYKASSQPWSDWFAFEPPQFQATPMAIQGGNDHNVHALWGVLSNPFYYATAPLTQTITSAIQQTVTIPDTLHRPTLSFQYAIDAHASPASYLAVLIGDSVTTTQVFSVTTSTPWQLGWSDLERWQGETVTVTFRVHQAAGALPLRAHLDDIALTSWQTAVLHGFSPQHVTSSLDTTLVVTGENFIGTPIIQLGDRTLAGVQVINDGVLHVPLPADLALGQYELWIKNAGDAPRSYGGIL
ncbi:MAG: PD40 domain-containing protein, partial [Caldilineaceae bacterium]|nr:PD40 domain-containing protein [Caldilineaceae bacterium]